MNKIKKQLKRKLVVTTLGKFISLRCLTDGSDTGLLKTHFRLISTSLLQPRSGVHCSVRLQTTLICGCSVQCGTVSQQVTWNSFFTEIKPRNTIFNGHYAHGTRLKLQWYTKVQNLEHEYGPSHKQFPSTDPLILPLTTCCFAQSQKSAMKPHPNITHYWYKATGFLSTLMVRMQFYAIKNLKKGN